MNKYIYLILCLGIVAILGFIFFSSPRVAEKIGEVPAGQVYVVELREDGFFPPEITINSGDTLRFTTTSGKPFWPASNLHPSHAIYPEFDPKEPIDPNQSWAFQFNKIGRWQYHDHLSPLYRGLIVVK